MGAMLHRGKSQPGSPLSRSRERVGVRVAGIATPLNRRQSLSEDGSFAQLQLDATSEDAPT